MSLTKSKLLKILNNYDSQSIVISLCDYYKLELDKIKSHIEKNGFFSFDKNDYITKTIKIADLIAFAESKDNFNGNVQIDDNIRYNEDKTSIFDIARNIDKYLKHLQSYFLMYTHQKKITRIIMLSIKIS